MDYQKQLTDHSLTSAELLAWTDPGIAARAERIATLEHLLGVISQDKGSSAVSSRQALHAEIERLNARSALVEPFERARDAARATYAAALESCTGAERWISTATSDDERDLAELDLKKAQRAAGLAAAALREALQAQPPPDVVAGARDLSPIAIFQAREDTKQLAALAPKLASYDYASRSNSAIDTAVAQGRTASGAMALWAVSEHDYRDPAARQLFDLRWLCACQANGVDCDRSSLNLPQPTFPE